MSLVPGVAITNALRDTISGDFISGLSRGMEAIFSALAIAFGVGFVLNIYLRGGNLMSILIQLLLAFLSTIGFAILFSIPKKIHL